MLKREKKLAQNTFSYIQGYLSKSDFVLDVGTGKGLVADLIRKDIGAKVKGIDVIDINCVNKETLIFNGEDIPFKDNSFTTTICCFVLHHAFNQTKLLQEMKRVTKSRIIIFEDTPQTFFDKAFGIFHGFLSVFPYKSARALFRSDNEWRILFKDIGLKLEKAQRIKKTRDIIYPVERRIYILEPQ